MRLGLDLALRLLEAALPVGLRLFLDATRHRLRDLAGFREDLLALSARLADERTVLFEQPPRLVPGLVRLFDRPADSLAPLVDRLLDVTECESLEDVERDPEADDRPDHQAEANFDQWIRSEHQTRTRARSGPSRPKNTPAQEKGRPSHWIPVSSPRSSGWRATD